MDNEWLQDVESDHADNGIRELVSLATKLVFPPPGMDVDFAVKEYREYVSKYKEEALSSLAKEYQTMIDSIHATFTYLDDVEAVKASVLEKQNEADVRGEEAARSIMNGLASSGVISADRYNEIYEFLEGFSGEGKLMIAAAVRLAIIANTPGAREKIDGNLNRA